MKISSLLAALLFALTLASMPSAESAQPATHSIRRLHALFKRQWQRHLRENPIAASLDGFHAYDDQWPDASLAAIEREHREDKQALAALEKIDRAALPAKARLSYNLFGYKLKDRIAGYRFHGYLLALNQLGGIQTTATLTRQLRFKSAEDYANWVKRLQSFAPYMDQTIALLRKGIEQGMTEPKVVMKRVPHQIAAQVVEKPEKSPFYRPSRTCRSPFRRRSGRR